VSLVASFGVNFHNPATQSGMAQYERFQMYKNYCQFTLKILSLKLMKFSKFDITKKKKVGNKYKIEPSPNLLAVNASLVCNH
jgi:hypothetical protein